MLVERDELVAAVQDLRDWRTDAARELRSFEQRQATAEALLERVATRVDVMEREDEKAEAIAIALRKQRGALFSRGEKMIGLLLALPAAINLILRLSGVGG